MTPNVNATQNTAFMVFLLNRFARRTNLLQNGNHSVAGPFERRIACTAVAVRSVDLKLGRSRSTTEQEGR